MKAALVTVFLLVVHGATASAVPISVVNPDFELPSISNPGGSLPATGWVSSFGGGSFRVTTTQLPVGPHSGSNVLYLNSNTTVAQVLGDVLSVSTQYTLSVYLTERLGLAQQGEIQLLAGGVLLAQSTQTATTNQWVIQSLVFQTGSTHALVGQPLEIRLRNASGEQALYDDVALDSTVIPEPTTLCLIGLGVACLSARRVRESAE